MGIKLNRRDLGFRFHPETETPWFCLKDCPALPLRHNPSRSLIAASVSFHCLAAIRCVHSVGSHSRATVPPETLLHTLMTQGIELRPAV